MNTDSIFTKIIKRELPATIVYEDDEFIAFNDIHPHAPIHVLLVPKKPYATLEEVNAEDADFHAKILQTARKVATLLGTADNYRLVMNVGEGVQAVPHVHLHILGGWKDTSSVKEQRLA
jgi:histidine triad (HIT) family protein